MVDEIGKAQGGFYEESKVVANDGQKWLGVPWCVLGAMIVYRKSWFAEPGAKHFPATWEEYRAVGKKLKAAGHPSARLWAIPSAMRRASHTRISGPGAARRSRRTARP